MLSHLLSENNQQFGILDMHNAHLLSAVRVTSFVWSLQQGVACYAANKKYYQRALDNPGVILILCPPEAVTRIAVNKCTVVAEKADQLFYFLHNQAIHRFGDVPVRQRKIASSAIIHPSAVIEEYVDIGERVEIAAHCMVMNGSVIGEDCILHPGVTIGTQGFFSKWILGKKQHIEHFGGVVLGKNCIIHTGTNISRSANFNEYTQLGDDVHIGIHSNIGHDCAIGNNVDISAKVLLAGRVKVGDNVWIGAGTVVSNALVIGTGAEVRIGSVVIDDIDPDNDVSGNFAISHKKRLKQYLKDK